MLFLIQMFTLLLYMLYLYMYRKIPYNGIVYSLFAVACILGIITAYQHHDETYMYKITPITISLVHLLIGTKLFILYQRKRTQTITTRQWLEPYVRQLPQGIALHNITVHLHTQPHETQGTVTIDCISHMYNAEQPPIAFRNWIQDLHQHTQPQMLYVVRLNHDIVSGPLTSMRYHNEPKQATKPVTHHYTPRHRKHQKR